jgi:phytoene dehydrogenase-like protein
VTAIELLKPVPVAVTVGWPIPVGGSQSIIDAMRDDLLANGGSIHAGTDVTDVRDLPPSAVTLMDVAPRALASIGAAVLPESYLRRMRSFRYGDGVAKVDFALNAPVPWTLPEARQAGTVHLGGDRQAIALAESEVAAGRHAADPYVLVSQPSLFDPSRAPATKHSLWAYIHVPRGSDLDPTEDVIRMIERSAPGFRDLVEASRSMSATQLEQYDPNFIGGDISIGALSLGQMVGRPVFSTRPWRTPRKGMYLASSATPPATGVHGLCGFYAARTALADVFNLPVPHLGFSPR